MACQKFQLTERMGGPWHGGASKLSTIKFCFAGRGPAKKSRHKTPHSLRHPSPLRCIGSCSWQCMNHFLTLPNEILQFEIFSYLATADIARLDVAISNHKLRPLLFGVYSAISLKHKKEGLTLAQMVWFFRRSIPLQSITFDPRLLPGDISDIFEVMESEGSNAARVQHMTLSPCSDTAGGMACFVLLTLCCTGLQSLTIQDCKPVAPPVLEKLREQHNTSLRCLDLSAYKELTDDFVVALSQGCPSLTTLDLSHSPQLSDISVATLAAGCPSLTSLLLHGCGGITNAAVQSLSLVTPSSLAVLDFAWCHRIDDDALLSLSAGCDASLTSLHLGHCNAVSDAGIIALAHRCSLLTALNVERCILLTDAAVAALSRGCSGLTSLNLGGCAQLTDFAMFALSDHLTSLRKLTLDRLQGLTDTGIIALAHRCSLLTALDVERCSLLTDAAVAALSRGCAGLTSLDASYCPALTDAACVSLALCEEDNDREGGQRGERSGCNSADASSSSSALTALDLSGCAQLTEASVVALARGCPRLLTLSLSLTSVSNVTAKALASGCPALTQLSYS